MSEGRYFTDQQISEMRSTYAKDAMRHTLSHYFGVSTIDHEVGSENIRCRFDATAPDESKEVRWVTISTNNAPEKNMEILREARRQQHMYETTRHEMPGIDVPLPPPDEKAKDQPSGTQTTLKS